MIGCFTVKGRVKQRPEVVLWRGAVLALGQVLACLAHGDACPAGGRTQIGGGCEQGVLPEVVGLPPGDLIKQVRVGAAVQRGRDQDRVLELLVLPAAEGAFGQEPLPDPLQVQWVSAAGPAPGQSVGGEAEEDLAGEGVVARVQRRQLAQQFIDVCAARQPVQQEAAGDGRVLRGGPFPGSHTPRVGPADSGQPKIKMTAAWPASRPVTSAAKPLATSGERAGRWFSGQVRDAVCRSSNASRPQGGSCPY